MIVGSGAIGVEFASIYAAMGTAVMLIELAPRILPGEDAEVTGLMAKALQKLGVAIHTSVSVGRVDKADHAVIAGGAGTALLVIGGAGGVGSILIQLARCLTAMSVIATASRPESADWCRGLDAHHVVDHTGDLEAQIAVRDAPPVTYIAGSTQTDQHFAAIAQIVAPQCRVALIDDPRMIDVRMLKQKSVSLHWEFMFTRSMFQTPDIIRQHDLPHEVAKLVDLGRVRSTLRERLDPISAENLFSAHRMLESGASLGKIVLAGFQSSSA